MLFVDYRRTRLNLLRDLWSSYHSSISDGTLMLLNCHHWS
ncbi:hypothetical protein YSA_02633 [Pseudomonas putida ND6]|uniref:Uncharacterized protein n=1 Tax=Pseudomonas putida ND6 TaxID=231023 RepID=I3URS9_PSEPU|nr:hypothetical protein YSA_02633 [Pseudomonas putida ND6]